MIGDVQISCISSIMLKNHQLHLISFCFWQDKPVA